MLNRKLSLICDAPTEANGPTETKTRNKDKAQRHTEERYMKGKSITLCQILTSLLHIQGQKYSRPWMLISLYGYKGIILFVY